MMIDWDDIEAGARWDAVRALHRDSLITSTVMTLSLGEAIKSELIDSYSEADKIWIGTWIGTK